ncbi:hypothetical protein FOL47_009129 [Perkinsus chesapeaki]|uniref:Uncharacterized protein n=1 Tax=Perkinsus chesapeaki TaxID=330153 RepID=A0A7J6LAB5_PERCH|nr:hypothetical protein FOL47_009129 [Perkinsus chesapeaki]
MRRCSSQPSARNLCREVTVKAISPRERIAKEIPQDLAPTENEDNLLVDLRMFHDKKARMASHFDDNPVIQDMLALAQRNRSSMMDVHQHGISTNEARTKLLSPPAKELRKMQYMLLNPPRRRGPPPPEHRRTSANQDPFRSNRSSVVSRRASNRELQIPRLPLHQIGSNEPCGSPVITLVIGGRNPDPRSTRASRLRAQSVERALKRYKEDDEADRLLTKLASSCGSRTDWISLNKKFSVDSLLFKNYDHLKRLAYLSSHRLRSPQVCVSTQVTSTEKAGKKQL